jgi:alpha-L-fucosidase
MRAPKPRIPVPSERQLKWHALEAYGFIHFSINTFTDKEWGYGDEPPELFNPSEFEADQIASTLMAAGLKGLVLTCKHHDGFCLWPSQHTEYSVKNSLRKNGTGDMVREFADACTRHDLKFGVYLSPRDRKQADYGTPAYLEYYRAQLRELLSNYGPIFEVWCDGANGGDGYYGGAREARTIDNETYYDWDNTWQIVRQLQPDACIFSDAGPDVRWVGNEQGFAGDPCWSTINPEGIWPGHSAREHLNRGDRNATHWIPAEVDVSVRPSWFFHENETIKPVSHLLKIYFESVGRGANLILDLAPDRRGLIPQDDVAVLKEWKRILTETFANDLAASAHVENHVNARIIQWSHDVTFNVTRLRESLLLGQRIAAFALDFWGGGTWHEFAAAMGIGNCRLIATPAITTSRVRLRITEAVARPAISELGFFMMPALREEVENRQA